MKRIEIFAGLCLLGLSYPAAAVGHLVEVNVYDRTSRQILPVYKHEGRWYVAGRPGNEYEVHLRNTTDADLLSVVSVDGVNAITGQTASASQSGYVLKARASVDIAGWRKSLHRIARFYFTDHWDAYATRTDRPDDVGVIGVAVFKRKAFGADPSPQSLFGESSRRADAHPPAKAQAAPSESPGAADAAKPSIGTGHGRGERSHARYVEFERGSEEPDEVVVIQYDTHANLVAQGVIRPSVRNPNPFPAHFVPDPPRY